MIIWDHQADSFQFFHIYICIYIYILIIIKHIDYQVDYYYIADYYQADYFHILSY